MTIQEAFSILKSKLELNSTFDEIVQQRHNAVRSVIENNHPGAQTQLIGSLQRKTRIRPRSQDNFDIDILVILGTFDQWVSIGGITPQIATEKMRLIIGQSSRYENMNPVVDQPTISISYEDNVKVEFVPAYLDNIGHSPNGTPHSPKGRGYWIPKGNLWELADYNYEADFITQQNKISDGFLIPTIKMLKALRRAYIHKSHMPSFHFEIIATHLIPRLISIYKQNRIPITYPDLIIDFFEFAPRFFDPIRIQGSNSPDVHLDSLAKPIVEKTFDDIKRYWKNISTSETETARIKAWKELFGEPFPST